MAAEADAQKPVEEEPPAAGDQKTDEAAVSLAAAAADVDDCSDDDDDDPVIRNLNLMSRRNLMTPEWIENRKKQHYEEIELYNRAYDALDNDDLSSDDEAGAAEYEEWSKKLWASVDFSGLNTVGGESRGMDAVAVYPAFLYDHSKSQPEDREEDQDAPAANSSS